MKKYFLTAFLLVMLGLGTTQAQKSVDWFQGAWRGVGFQPEDKQYWDMYVKYDESTRMYLVSYSSLGCTGEWRLTKSGKNKAEFIEVLTNDNGGSCNNLNEIIITPIDEKRVAVAFFIPEYSESVLAFTVLEKVENQGSSK